MKIFIKASQAILILSFFLPFMKTCTFRGTTEVHETSDSVLVAPAQSDFNGTIQKEPISATENSSLYIPTRRKPSTLEELWKFLILPDYSVGLTGFGLSLMITETVIESGILVAADITFLLIPISLILAIFLVIVPIKNIKLLSILSAIGCLSLYLFLILLFDSIDEILFGFWISLVVFSFNVLILFRELNKVRLKAKISIL